MRDLFSSEDASNDEDYQSISVGQEYALRLKRKMNGYRAELGDASGIVVLVLDSATPGRLAITYYRFLSSSEFLDTLEAWHRQCCWHQNYGPKQQFIGAPAPKDIVEAVYGLKANEKLCNTTLRQILACIIDGAALPRNLVNLCVQRVCNPHSFKNKQEWEKVLGIACALYIKYTIHQRSYHMSLETKRTTRDYLFGRLLALAEYLEEAAQRVSGEQRETHACRMMMRFASKPFETWRTIELALQPYKERLLKNRPGLLHILRTEVDTVMEMFQPQDFTSSHKLTGEFLLGYHCQRAALRQNANRSSERSDISAAPESIKSAEQ
jgi:CRISPR-associated protein Csd1